jgi:Late exocytosis, associated with Golgi transport/Cytosolic domain of 10TM putative phosphate transporter
LESSFGFCSHSISIHASFFVSFCFGQDAICYLRALRFGRDLAIVCCLNAVWLIPLYATAPQDASNSADGIQKDTFVSISISNLPNGSPRFLGTVVAAYITFFATMYLLHRESRWFVKYRHKYLAMKKCCNYAVYVSGIPTQYRSSADLAQYFRSCAGSVDAVLEAHVTMNVPDLESKVNRREHVVHAIEHAVALTQKRKRKNSGSGSNNNSSGSKWRIVRTQSSRSSHVGGGLEDANANVSVHHYKLDPRRGRFERVETIASLEKELWSLDREIRMARRHLLLSSAATHQNPRRAKLRRANASKNLMVENGDVGNIINNNTVINSSPANGNGIVLRRSRADSTGGDGTNNGAGAFHGVGAGGAVGGAAGFLRERLRTGTVDYDHGDAMDDELRKILVPDEVEEHEYDEFDDDDDDDVEANIPDAFERYNPADMSSGGGELDDDELTEVIDGPAASASASSMRSTTPGTLQSTSTLGKYSTTAVLDDPIGEYIHSLTRLGVMCRFLPQL